MICKGQTHFPRKEVLDSSRLEQGNSFYRGSLGLVEGDRKGPHS